MVVGSVHARLVTRVHAFHRHLLFLVHFMALPFSSSFLFLFVCLSIEILNLQKHDGKVFGASKWQAPKAFPLPSLIKSGGIVLAHAVKAFEWGLLRGTIPRAFVYPLFKQVEEVRTCVVHVEDGIV